MALSAVNHNARAVGDKSRKGQSGELYLAVGPHMMPLAAQPLQRVYSDRHEAM